MDAVLARRRSLPPGGAIETWPARDGWPLGLGTWREGARGTLLLLNGRADFLGKYAEALWHWRERGWAIAAPDWRGQGLSGRLGRTPLHGHADSVDPWLDDLATILGRLADWPRPLVALGHSMGGHLLLRALAGGLAGPERVALTAPMLGLRLPLPRPLAAAVAGAAVALGAGGRFAPGQRGRLPPATERLRARVLTSCPERQGDEAWWLERHPERRLGGVTWGWLAAALASLRALDAPGVVEGVRLPVLALLARDERVVDGAAAKRMLARLPHGRYAQMEGRHELLREADGPRAAVMARLDAFLETGGTGG
jgi:lysophospholipase